MGRKPSFVNGSHRSVPDGDNRQKTARRANQGQLVSRQGQILLVGITNTSSEMYQLYQQAPQLKFKNSPIRHIMLAQYFYAKLPCFLRWVEEL